MGEKEYPNEVTEENFPELVEKAKKIKKRAYWLMYAVTGFYSLVGMFAVIPFTFYLLGLVLKLSVPELSPEAFNNLLIGVFFVFFPFVIYLFLDFTILIFERFLGLPKSEEKVFAGCFVVANYLMKNEKENALKEVKDFTTNLSVFLSDSSKVKRKAYSTEFKLLIKGKTQIKRMVLFSKENIAELFIKFGLAFVRGEDQEAFSNLKKLVNEVLKFGQPTGFFSKFLALLNQIKYLLLFITAVGELIAIFLKIMGIF